MKPRRTHVADGVLRLPGGTEDNDLWFQHCQDATGNHIYSSVWEPTDEERAAIANGANVELLVWGTRHPPVAVATSEVPLGKPDASS